MASSNPKPPAPSHPPASSAGTESTHPILPPNIDIPQQAPPDLQSGASIPPTAPVPVSTGPPVFKHGSGPILTPPPPKPIFPADSSTSSVPPMKHGDGPVEPPPPPKPNLPGASTGPPAKHSDGPILTPPPPKPTFPNSSKTIPTVTAPSAATVPVTAHPVPPKPPLPNTSNTPVTIPHPKTPPAPLVPPGTLVPPGPNDLTVLAATPAQIWALTQLLFAVKPGSTDAFNQAQTESYTWVSVSIFALFDDDPKLRASYFYSLIDYVNKAKSMAGLESIFLSLLYSLRQSTDQTNIKAGLKAWNDYAKTAIGVQGSGLLFFMDLKTRMVFFLGPKTMDYLRKSSDNISPLDSLSVFLKTVAGRVIINPFGRTATSSLPNATVSHEIQMPGIVQRDSRPDQSDPGGPSDPGWFGSKQEAVRSLWVGIAALSGGLIKGALDVGKIVGPRVSSAIAQAVSAAEDAAVLAEDTALLPEGLAFVTEFVLPIVTIAATPLTIAVIVVGTGILAWKVYEQIYKVQTFQTKMPDPLPTLSVGPITIVPSGPTTKTSGPTGGGSPTEKPEISAPVHGGDSGNPNSHGGSGHPVSGPSTPSITGSGPISGPPGSGQAPSTSPHGGSGPSPPLPGPDPSGQPLDPNTAGHPHPVGQPGEGGGTQTPIPDEPKEPGGTTPTPAPNPNPPEPVTPTPTPTPDPPQPRPDPAPVNPDVPPMIPINPIVIPFGKTGGEGGGGGGDGGGFRDPNTVHGPTISTQPGAGGSKELPNDNPGGHRIPH